MNYEPEGKVIMWMGMINSQQSANGGDLLAIVLEEQGLLPKKSGYHYRDSNMDVPMVEYHVDIG